MKKIFILTILSLIVLFTSCSDSAIGDEYGRALLYMPQATHNLGSDNNLELTLSAAAIAKNPNMKSKTTLGVYRSGTHDKIGATVDLVVNPDTVDRAKLHAMSPTADSKFNIYKTGIMLASSYYAPLSGQLTIPDGSRQATTQLILDDEKIFADYSIGQILLLPVEIKNPTRYELNKSLSLTMVVIRLIE